MNPVVAINAFPTDTNEEVQLVQAKCTEMGVNAIVAKGWAEGGGGMTELAKAVVAEVESGKNNFVPLYNWNISIKDKIETIATETLRSRRC